MKKLFSKRLLRWYEANHRDLPWKKTKDPYKIWLSEIILQQTRVEQGLPYYFSITEKFPSVYELANASEDEVMKAWQGLGYYSRARNLHAAAKQIVGDFRGEFPKKHEEILVLKGVGDYTAAAISSFAFDLPHAVVDGNVIRVLSRIFGIKEPADTSSGKKIINALAQELLDKKNPAAYNQAIMNFGAIFCTPVNPDCTECIFTKECFAYNHNAVSEFPVKAKKILVRKRWFVYLVIEYKDHFFIERRNENDIWKSLYQFPLLEIITFKNIDELKSILSKEKFFRKNEWSIRGLSNIIEHKLTHQTIMTQFLRIKVKRSMKKPPSWIGVRKSDFSKFAFPKVLDNYIRNFIY